MTGLFLSYNSLKGETSGGTLIASRNLNYFKSFDSKIFNIEVYDSSNILLESQSLKKNALKILKNIIHFQTLSFNDLFLEVLFKRIKEGDVDFIFLDSSLFGGIAKKIKKKFPEVKIITYSHNVELISSWHSLVYEFSFKKFYSLIFSFISESYTSKYSHHLIGISSYDDKIYKKLYKRGFDSVIPVTIQDKKRQIDLSIRGNKNYRLKILFVGSYFYPNVHGIKWFIDNVFDNIDADLIIVGSGMGALGKKYQSFKKLQFHDYVQDLSAYYEDCHIVISPIFIGSGMKVKVAEALMFGKVILGSSLSFQGYKVEDADCYVCDRKEDFINKINELKYLLKTDLKYSENSRKTFLDFYANNNDNTYFIPVSKYIYD